MAMDTGSNGTASGLGDRPLLTYISGWDIAETAGATAVVKIRDSLALPKAPTLAQGAAGNVDVGVHYYAMTWVTTDGESVIGPSPVGAFGSTTIATSAKHVTVTVPVYASDPVQYGRTVAGRRLYRTKAGAPAAATTPTNAQWWLVSADIATTIAAASNALPLPQATLNVASTTNLAASGNVLVTTDQGVQLVAYAAVGSGTTLTGCTGGVGVMSTGGAVTQPMLGDNTTTSYDDNIADGSLTATHPPTKDTAGRLTFPRITLAANSTEGHEIGPNVLRLQNDGGAYVEVTSGAVEFTVRGQ